jgi:hypothetical protein
MHQSTKSVSLLVAAAIRIERGQARLGTYGVGFELLDFNGGHNEGSGFCSCHYRR